MRGKTKTRWITAVLAAMFLWTGSAMAAFDEEGIFYFDNNPTEIEGVAPGDGLWSTVDNWHSQYLGGQTNSEGFFPNSNLYTALIAQTNESVLVTSTNIAILDGDYTVMRIGNGYGMRHGADQGLARITSPGGFGLTIDGTAYTNVAGINTGGNNFFGCFGGPQGVQFPGPSIYGQTGSRLEIDVPLVITNGYGNQITWIENRNSPLNETVLTTNSSLTLHNLLGINKQSGGIIEINCPMLPSLTNVIIQTDNLSFNEGHDSSNFGHDFVFQTDVGAGADLAKLVVNGGTVLAPFRKFQINGESAIEMNSAYSVNGPDIVVDGFNNLLLDVNADQDLGRLTLGAGILTIDLHTSVTNLAFADSSTNVWDGFGSVVISNFMSEVVRFGTDANGITPTQFSIITAFDVAGLPVTDLGINTDGYLTGTATPTETPASLYAVWCALYPTLANTNFTHDAEPDGIVNLMEYALGGNPVVDDAAAISPSSSMEDIAGSTFLLYVYSRRLDALERGLTYAVLSGTDLTAGPLATPTIEVESGAVNANFETVTNAVSAATEDVQFMNLKVDFTP